MKILIELPTWLGDSIMTTPAIENILKNQPIQEELLELFIGKELALETKIDE